MKRNEITQEMVKELFTYKSGKLFWKIKPKNQIQKGARVGKKQGVYQRATVNGVTFLEHKLIFLYHKGYIPKYIDHIKDTLTNEGIKSNKIGNLRETSHKQNMQKARCLSKGYRGVVKIKNGFGVALGRLWLGIYKTSLDACIVYDKKALQLYGEHCFTNLPKKNYLENGKYYEYFPIKNERRLV